MVRTSLKTRRPEQRKHGEPAAAPGRATQAPGAAAFLIGAWCSLAASRVWSAVVARSNRAAPTTILEHRAKPQHENRPLKHKRTCICLVNRGLPVRGRRAAPVDGRARKGKPPAQFVRGHSGIQAVAQPGSAPARDAGGRRGGASQPDQWVASSNRRTPALQAGDPGANPGRSTSGPVVYRPGHLPLTQAKRVRFPPGSPFPGVAQQLG